MLRSRYQSPRFSLVGSLALALALIIGSASLTLAQSGTPAATPVASSAGVSALEAVPCATHYQIAAPFVDGQNIDCSYLLVPAFPGETGSPVMRLHVMRLHSTGSAPATEPLILLSGGPGQAAGSLLSAFAPATDQSRPSLAPMLERQDVILLDQRGTGASDPSLTCAFDAIPSLVPPAQASGTPPAATPIATPAGGTPAPIELPDSQQLVDLTVQCMDSFKTQGIDLSAFNTENDAADVAALIRALGVPQADLYGVSYGSYLGQRVITRTPELIRSAVLASIVPPGTDLYVGQIVSFNGVLSDVFSQCSADTTCAEKNPDLETAFEAAYNRLSQKPATVQATDFVSGQTVPIAIDGKGLLSLTYQLAFASLSYAIPPLISSVAAGDDSVLTDVSGLLLVPSGISTGQLASVSCQDFVPNGANQDIGTALADGGVRPVLVDGFSEDARAFREICAEEQLPASPSLTEATISTVPTLLVSGELDPITPPEYADEVLPGLANGQEVTINAVGHDPVSASGPCGLELATSFLAAPTEEVDQTCASQLALDFSPDAGAATPQATPLATPAS